MPGGSDPCWSDRGRTAGRDCRPTRRCWWEYPSGRSPCRPRSAPRGAVPGFHAGPPSYERVPLPRAAGPGRMLVTFCRATDRNSSSSLSVLATTSIPSESRGQRVCLRRGRGSSRTRCRGSWTCRRRRAKSRNRRSCPSCSIGMYSAASSTRSRTSSGVSIARVDRRNDADENPLFRLHVLADDPRAPARGRARRRARYRNCRPSARNRLGSSSA